MPHSPVENLRIWKEGITLAKSIYEYTSSFPNQELYGLTSQMRRAAVSIPSNIAEGSQRGTDKDFAHFLVIARGSCAELKTQVILAKQLGFGHEKISDEILAAIQNIGSQIGAFHKQLRTNEKSGG